MDLARLEAVVASMVNNYSQQHQMHHFLILPSSNVEDARHVYLYLHSHSDPCGVCKYPQVWPF